MTRPIDADDRVVKARMSDPMISLITPARLVVALALVGCAGVIGGESPEGTDVSSSAGAGSHDGQAGAAARGVPGAGITTCRAPEAGAGTPGGPNDCAAAPRRLWLLTPAQYAATVATMASGLSDVAGELRGTFGQGSLFLNEPGRLRLSVPHVSALYTLARRISGSVAAAPANLDACLAKMPGDRTCVRNAIGSVAARAFRRPLTASELDGYLAHYDALVAGSTDRAALAQVIQTMLMSPHFLFRTELGPEGAPAGLVIMTPFEKASALAYLITEAPPDAELAQAAGQGALETAAQIEAQTRRLLAKPEVARGLSTFFREKYRLDRVLAITKDSKAFPELSGTLTADMARETSSFIEEALWRGDGRWQTLLTAPYSVVNERLAKLYGIAGVTGTQFRKIDLPPQRAGMLLQANLLSVLATERDSDVIRRGRFVREAILCGRVPDPPPTVNAVFPASDGKSTQRERLAVHRSDPTCASCHNLLDSLGLPLEGFDALGKYRTTEAGKAIDPSGVLNGLRGADIPVRDARQYVEALAAAPETSECVLGALAQYAGAPAPADGAVCVPRDLAASFAATNGNLREALVALTSGKSFFVRN